MSHSKKNILVMMTGSIACYKACSIISKLIQLNYNVKVVMSESSLQFVGAATIEGLTGEKVITGLYEPGHMMDHIYLNRWADLILVAPATANYINRISHGMGDDLLTTLFLAHDFKKPFLIAPAMNTMMYLHPTTVASVKKLKEMNIEILETASGVLACGEVGVGRLLEPELIIDEIQKRLENASEKNKNIRVLITSGGTTEPIDDVRVITNKSTGATACEIANELLEFGANVTYLHSESAQTPQTSGYQKISFNSFQDLKTKLESELKLNFYDWVIHAAAVSDYSVEPQNGKINSSAEEIILKLKKNPKLIDLIKQISPKTKLVGFKLTSTHDTSIIQNKVSLLFKNANCDFVVQNDWNDIKDNVRKFSFYSNKNNDPLIILTTKSLAQTLSQEIL